MRPSTWTELPRSATLDTRQHAGRDVQLTVRRWDGWRHPTGEPEARPQTDRSPALSIDPSSPGHKRMQPGRREAEPVGCSHRRTVLAVAHRRRDGGCSYHGMTAARRSVGGRPAARALRGTGPMDTQRSSFRHFGRPASRQPFGRGTCRLGKLRAKARVPDPSCGGRPS